jgi:hypothetical protein
MKNIFKKVFALLLVVCSVLVLVGCGNSDEKIAELEQQLKDAQAAAASAAELAAANQAELEARVAELEEELAAAEEEGENLLDLIDAYQEQIAAQKDVYDAQLEALALLQATMAQFDKDNANSLLAKAIAQDPTFDFSDEQWRSIEDLETIAYYVIEEGTNVEAVSEMVGSCCNALMGFFSATGAYSYVAWSYAERTKILAVLEEYAVNKGLTGLTLYSSAGYALYNEGVTLGTDTYIVGYGFGAIAEGTITKGLNYEGMNPDYAMYYHSYETSDPASLNYGDDKGSVVGDLQPMVAGSYWGTKMNNDKDGYVWYNDLAWEKPQAVESTVIEGTNLATSYTFTVRIGSALKYATLSQDPAIAAFNGREVALEDYLVPFKTLWTQANGWARATDNHGSSNELVGEEDFYYATEEGFDEAAWNKVGIKAEAVDETHGRLTFTFKTPCNSFYAMYYLASSIYAPCPQEFMDLVGADHFGKFDTENNRTPLDTMLSTGVFVVESWTHDEEIVMKKNALNDREEGRYDVAGVHYDILTAAATDKEAAFKEFMAGKLSAASVPSTQLENYMGKTQGTSDAGVNYYVKQTRAGSTYKLNMNTLDQETWYKFFGENGTITQTALADSWECEPIMSNHDFYLGLSYALDRQGLATKLGVDFSVNYFGDVYLSDPENGVAYNSTPEHQAAIASLIQDEDHDGYDVEIARQYFDKAARACLAAGLYKEGDVIEIEIAWMYPSDEDEYHNFIKKCFEDAFNDASVAEGKLTLKVVFWASDTWSDVYYNKMMPGQYDIGFGSISGNSLNPINFLEVLKSDNSSGFTLNWGADTSLIDENLVFDGKIWSFDALWLAADQGGYFENGVPAQTINPTCTSVVKNEDGSQTITIDLQSVKVEGVEAHITQVVIYAYLTGGVYDEDALEIVVEGDVATCTVSAELCAKYAAANLYDGGRAAYLGSYHAIDVYYSATIAKVPTEGLKTIPAFIDLQ